MRSVLMVSVLVVLLFSATVSAQNESKLHAEFRREGERVADSCGAFGLMTVAKCGYTLFTDHPLHIAAGSMPPKNGFGLGAAFVTGKNVTNWRMTWDLDAVGAFSGAWRAGAYMKLIHTPKEKLGTSQPGTSAGSSRPLVHPYTVFNIYAQSISLPHVDFFGLGNNSNLAGATEFAMRETIVGISAIKPVFEVPGLSKLNLALVGEANGRFVDINGSHGQTVPSIETLYNDATAPGLTHQPGFLQFTEGVRIKPSIGDVFQFNYLASFQQFVAPSDSSNSFLRWTVDLNHTLSLYRNQSAVVIGSDRLGPDHCAPTGSECPPPVATTRNRQGAIGVRLFVSESITSATSAVPFYFQPTLGGGDLNGNLTLGSYRDYRFRAPNVLLLQESIEHSIWGPFGVKFMADQGRVALTRGDLGFDHFRHSFAGGLTLRAGAFPMVSLMFAWGGREGHHNIVNMNTTLLGGSSRPSLY